MYHAYKQGRSPTNPADFWAKGEIGFFDFYMYVAERFVMLSFTFVSNPFSLPPSVFNNNSIPLAKKLKDCGVFGVSSDEYLKYAESNRKEWEQRGASVVSEMLERLEAESAKSKPESAQPEQALNVV